MLFLSLRNEVKNRREIALSHNLLELEKSKSDKLLLNILPKETAEELKANGKALPKLYNSVSVLFTDFIGFTHLSENMDPELLLSNLEQLFTRFDEVSEQNEMERIKTIGDGYMAAGGISIQNENTAVNAIKTGLQYLDVMHEFNKTQKESGLKPWKLRIGINTGQVIAGVIGLNKFAFDIWGSTVNLASRAESHGVMNRINITENTYNLVKTKFDCEYRGEIDVKNIGKTKMYIVIGYKKNNDKGKQV